MPARRALLLVALALFGLLAGLRPTPAPRPTPEGPPPPEAPIMAIRGQPLAEYEEPLPPGARVRIGSTRYRHPKSYEHLQVERAGDYFVTMADGRLLLTDAAIGRRLPVQPTVTRKRQSRHGIDFDLHNLSASPDGRIAVWNYGNPPDDRVVARLWQTEPDQERPVRPITSLRIPEAIERCFVEDIFFPEDRSEVWVVAEGVHAFDSATGALKWQTLTRNDVLAIDRLGKRFLTSGEHDPRFGRGSGGGVFVSPVYGFRPKGEASRAYGRARRGDGDASATELVTLTVAEARTGRPIGSVTLPRDQREPLGHLDLSPDGRYVSYEVADRLSVFDIDGHREVLNLSVADGEGDDRRWNVAASWFTDDCAGFVVLSRKCTATTFDLTTGKPVATEQGRIVGDIWHNVWTRKGPVTLEGMLRPPGGAVPVGYAGIILAESPDQTFLAIGDATGRVDVWQPNGRHVRTIGQSGSEITALAFSPNGTELAACDRTRLVRVWKVRSGAERERFEVPADTDLDELCPDHLAFRPDGRGLLVSRGDVLALWDRDARTWAWNVIGCDPSSHSAAPAFTPDGLRVLAHGQSDWLDARTGQRAGPLPGDGKDRGTRGHAMFSRVEPSNESAITLSLDGLQIAMIDDGGVLRVSQPGVVDHLQAFPESRSVHKNRGALHFSPDARRLVTCDDAGHAHVWEVASGQLAFTLTYPDGAIHDVRFGADGRSLITANHREVIVWDLAPDGPVADPWADLGHEAPRAEQARRALLADPDKVIALLQARLRPVGRIHRAAVAGLVRGLDQADYRGRERAAADLWALGRRVLPLLEDAKPESVEGKTRLAVLVRQLSAGPTADELRHVRAIEVLEQVGSPAARELIAELAAGDSGAVLTEEAARARGRHK